MTSQRDEVVELRIREAREQRLRRLDLGDRWLYKLPASLGDLPDLRELYLGLYALDESGGLISRIEMDRLPLVDLSGLSGLPALSRLDLSSTSVTDLTALSGLIGLENLGLQSTYVKDLTALSGLSSLRHLDVGRTGVTNIAALSRIYSLQHLGISGTLVTDLTALSGLSGLQSLDLSHTRVMDLAALFGLSSLQSLDLSSTDVTDVTALSGLSGLQKLDLSYSGVADLTALSCITGLRDLNLWFTDVKDLTALSGLSELQNLDLWKTGVTDLTALSGLLSLRKLTLSGTNVTDLTALSGLFSLQQLTFSGTDVTDLTALSGLSNLQRVDLSGTGVTDLTVLTRLVKLERLSANNCKIVAPLSLIENLVGHPSLSDFSANSIAGVPSEVLSGVLGDNCLPRIRSWHAELGLGREAENEVKIVLLGNGRVGKTQLCRRFRGEPFDSTVASTHGVQLWREALRLDVAGETQTFNINWWDFGGQDIYHGTHALFLRSRAVFVLLWNPAFENRDERDEGGVPVRNQPLAYWLDYVRTLAGADSPVVVVQSQCDEYGDRRADPVRPDGFGFFETCAYSARTDRGRETLESHLREAVRYLLDRSGALEIGRGRADVRRRLYAWRRADQALASHERRHRTLTRGEFQALCDDVGGIVSWEHALDYFHQTGVVFYRSDLFADRIVLDQDWALDAVYSVFHRSRAVPLLRDSGRFTQADLAALVWHEHSTDEQKLFLGLMESCGICFRSGATSNTEVRYLAPDLLPTSDSVHRLAWDDAADISTLQLDYRFFHPAIVRNVMKEVGRRAGDLATYWKYGLWFKDGKRGTQLRLRFVDTSTTALPGGGQLVLEAQGRDPLALLAEIRRSMLAARIGEPPEERLTTAGATVARSALGTLADGRVIALDKKLVPAERYAAFFDGREYDAKLDIEPQRITAEDKRPEVYISYAWGDDSIDGRMRTQAVDTLQSGLETDGFVPVRDRDGVLVGDRISPFMDRLARADHIVALVSDKYLRSYYCMYEIYRLWQRAQTDRDQMLAYVVPVVLPDVRIGSIEERKPYLQYWSDKARAADAAFADRDLRWSKHSWEEACLTRDFASHVDDILVFLQDVLMPRRLDAHIDDGFRAVREALRRRADAAS